jgi:hypothetical protein
MAVLKKIVDWIMNLLNLVVNLLPDSPFIFLEADYIPEEISNILPYVNWFIPVGTIMTIVETWLVAVVIYYTYQAILRWVKAID